MPDSGISAHPAYSPRLRKDRAAIAAVHARSLRSLKGWAASPSPSQAPP